MYVFHAKVFQYFNLICIKIEALHILHDPLQLFWNNTELLYSIGIIHTSCNNFGAFWIPLQDFFICHSFDLNIHLLLIPFIFCLTQWNASNYPHHNTINQYFLLDILRCLAKCGWVVDIIHFLLIFFSFAVSKRSITISWSGKSFLAKYLRCSIITHKYLVFVSFLTNGICLQYITFWFIHDPYFALTMTFEENGQFFYGKGNTKNPN